MTWGRRVMMSFESPCFIQTPSIPWDSIILNVYILHKGSIITLISHTFSYSTTSLTPTPRHIPQDEVWFLRVVRRLSHFRSYNPSPRHFQYVFPFPLYLDIQANYSLNSLITGHSQTIVYGYRL
jgi:hypothetical protein